MSVDQRLEVTDLIQAAGRAWLSDMSLAGRLAERALSVAEDPLDVARAHGIRSMIETRSLRPVEAERAANAGLEIHPEGPGIRAELFMHRAAALALRCEFDLAMADLDEALHWAAIESDTSTAIRAEFNLVYMFPLRDLEEGVARLDELLSQVEAPQVDDLDRGINSVVHLRLQALYQLCFGLCRLHRFSEVALRLEGVDLAAAGPATEAGLRLMLFWARLGLGEPLADQIPFCDELLELVGPTGDQMLLATVRTFCAYARGLVGEVDDALTELAEVLAQLDEVPFGRVLVLGFQAELMAHAGRLDEAALTMRRLIGLERELLEEGGAARVRALEAVREIRRLSHDLDQERGRVERLVSLAEQFEARIADRTAELRSAYSSLHEVAEQYRLVAEHTADLVARHRVDGAFAFLAPSCERVVGCSAEELVGTLLWELVYPGDVDAVRTTFRRVVARGRADIIEARLTDPLGRWRWFEFWFRPVLGEHGEVTSVHSAIRDASRHREAERELLVRSLTDPLTGLPNRVALLDYLEALPAIGLAEPGIGVLFLDLDRFKLVNDTRGHDVGDSLLREVAQRLRIETRIDEIACRLGGDEFVVAVPGVESTESLIARAEEIRDAICRPCTIGGQVLTPGVSIGAVRGHAGSVAEDLLRESDTALYRAKDAGRGRIVVFDERMRQESERRLEVESMIRSAIAEERLRLHLQPIWDTNTLELAAAEALVRIEGPDGRTIYPGDFIDVAEESGLIGWMGEWTLATAVGTLQQWLAEGSAVPIAVNLGTRELLNPRTVEIIEQAALPPGLLHLELTERTLLEAHRPISAVLDRLRSNGCVLALDDFGTAFSSITYLAHLPVQVVKIDRSFINDVIDDAADAAVVAVTVDLARSFACETVAEGVETEAQLQLIRDLGCTYVQGFLLGRPMPVEVFNPLELRPTVSA